MTKGTVNAYIRQVICLIAGLTLFFLLYIRVWGNADEMVVPVAISAVFQLVACLAYGLVWKWVSASAPGSLPTLYLAASGFRMLAGIMTVLAYLLAESVRSTIVFFVITFLTYYFVILVYDTWYFVRVEKKTKQNA